MPYNVRMAYATGANLNSLLLQQLSFRAGGNVPISSLYTLYANGQGQTYWSNSVSPTALAALSTSVGDAIVSTYVELSTLVSNTYGNGVVAELSTLEYYTYSSFSTVFYYQNFLLTQSTGLNAAFLSTANSFQVQLNSYYQSTLNVCISTVNSLSNVSSYNSAVSQLNSSTQIWLSTMSTGIGIGITSTNNYIINLLNYGLYSTVQWTAAQISTISTNTVSVDTFNTFSTAINSSILSTSDSFLGSISTINYTLYSDDLRLSTLEQDFTYLSTTGTAIIASTIFSTNIYSVNSSIVSLSGELTSTQLYLSNFSTIYEYDISCLVASTNANTLEINSLSTQFAVITTSSILEGIYSSFIELEQYTVNLINSTNTAYVYYLSSALSTQTATVEAVVTSSIYNALYTLSGEISTSLSTLTGQISTGLYTLSGEISTISANASAIVSTINSVQIIELNSNNFTAYLNFSTNYNFVIKINNIVDLPGSTFRVTFNPNSLNSAALQQGVILIDVSTNTQAYTQNNNLLAFDFNQWGIVNNPQFSNFPMIADSAYRMEYIYSVYNSSVYTSLTNIWPYQNTYNAQVASVDDNSGLDPLNERIYSTLTPLNISWQYYLFSNIINPSIFNSYINIDVYISSALIQTFGPYPYTQNNAVIIMPDGGYPVGTGTVSSVFATYVVGEPANASYAYGNAYY